MTGRLHKVDLASDLVLILLDEQALRPRALHERLAAIDAEPFVFEIDDDPATTAKYLHMYDEIGYLDTPDDERLELTRTGRNMVDALVDSLEPEQRAAVDDTAGVVA